MNMNVIGYALIAAAVLIPVLAIFLSKRGFRTYFLTIASFACLSGFLIISLFQIFDLANANNWTALIRDMTIRSKASVILAVVVVIINIIPFITYQTREDYKLKKARDKAFEEGKKAEQNKSEDTVEPEQPAEETSSEKN